MGLSEGFWRGRRVLLTGHTGFKGAWMVVALRELGAQVTGLALDPPTRPSLFELIDLREAGRDLRGDVRDAAVVREAVAAAEPEIVFHFAAQSLVRLSYADPAHTWSTNVMGTLNLLEACRDAPALRALVVATSDKCYENRETGHAFREDDRLGGGDPYSASKAAAELLVASHRRSFAFPNDARIATVRAGNVIGGGDFAADRLVPDAMRAFGAGAELVLRNPSATRPWQHVLDPLRGYLMLAEAMVERGDGAEAWNFGPPAEDILSVAEVADRLVAQWGGNARWRAESDGTLAEARLLALDSGKARDQLGWRPGFGFDAAIAATSDWYRRHADGGDVAELTREQARRALGLK